MREAYNKGCFMALQAENDRLQAENKKLHEQLSVAQNTVAETVKSNAKPPIYKEPSFYVSLLAVVVALLGALASWASWLRSGDALEVVRAEGAKARSLTQAEGEKARGLAHTTGVKARADLLRKAILELDKFSSTTPRFEVQYNVRFRRGSRLAANYGFDPINDLAARLHYETARKLEADVGDEIGYTEYLVLANFACAFAGFDEAEGYAQKALHLLDDDKGTSSRNNRSIVLITLAKMYFRSYPALPADKGRFYFREATDGLRKLNPDAKNAALEAEIWAEWGLTELRIGFVKEGGDCLKQAKRTMYAQSLPATFLAKWQGALRDEAQLQIDFHQDLIVRAPGAPGLERMQDRYYVDEELNIITLPARVSVLKEKKREDFSTVMKRIAAEFKMGNTEAAKKLAVIAADNFAISEIMHLYRPIAKGGLEIENMFKKVSVSDALDVGSLVTAMGEVTLAINVPYRDTRSQKAWSQFAQELRDGGIELSKGKDSKEIAVSVGKISNACTRCHVVFNGGD